MLANARKARTLDKAINRGLARSVPALKIALLGGAASMHRRRRVGRNLRRLEKAPLNNARRSMHLT